MKKCFFFLPVLFFLALSPIRAAETPGCRVCQAKTHQDLLSELRKTEALYARMRWTAERIRGLYYGPLWQARRLAMDPLHSEIREEGRVKEKTVRDIIAGRNRKFDAAANGLFAHLGEMRNFHPHYSVCCPERAYGDCMETALRPFYAEIGELKAYLEHVLESERDYLQAVSRTAGGPQGLYPEDAVEKESEHTDYYARFEMERESRRFEEDARVAEFFDRAYQALTGNFSGLNCCLSCKPVDEPRA